MLALLLPALLAADPPELARPNPTVPQPVDWTTLGDSVIDHSHFLVAPAGKTGRLRRDGARIVDGEGNRVRFWGINLSGNAGTPSHEDADLLADIFARWGFNRVRLHGFDASWGDIFPDGDTTRELDSNALDRLGYFVAALKAKGVYTNLNLNVAREYRSGDGVRDHEKLGYAKGPTFYDPRLIELQKEYARQLLTWRNPHTGLTFAEDPAVCTVEVVNENSLLEAWGNGRLAEKPVWGDGGFGGTWGQVPPSYVRDLHRLYGEWADAALPAEESADAPRAGRRREPGRSRSRLRISSATCRSRASSPTPGSWNTSKRGSSRRCGGSCGRTWASRRCSSARPIITTASPCTPTRGRRCGRSST